MSRHAFRRKVATELKDARTIESPPGESRSLEWAGAAPSEAERVIGRVIVRPDAFYRDFFADLLADPSRSSASMGLHGKSG